ncbi:MFS transporter [Verrucomicrobiota bacterium]|nr:MFS transporter [Verrucomicrobiota bacterium]
MSAPVPPIPAVTTPRPKLPRTVWALGWTSFFTDVSTEIIYPLLPIFLTVTLGATVAFVGLIEGVAECTASVLKVASGWWSDRVRRRKPFAVAGYALSGLTRPLLALAGSAGHVLAARFIDRVGKGIRSAPRDALLTEAVPADQRGAAFGVQRAMDNAGAVLGPLIAWALLTWVTQDFRVLFWIATVPMIAALLALTLGAKEQRPSIAAPAENPAPQPEPFVVQPRFKAYLALLFLFTLGNSSDAFLLLRAQSLGVSVAEIPLLWALLNLIKAVSVLPAGRLSDRIGRRPLVVGGWLIYALVYVAFGYAGSAWQVWALFAVYGLFYGLTEAAERAWVADLYPKAQRGQAYGWYHATVGLASLPASLLMGWLWHRFGPGFAFLTGAIFAGAAAMLLGLCLKPVPAPRV